MKNVLFTVSVAAAFALGLYSLFLAAANAHDVRSSAAAGFLRTAAAADTGKIDTAFGDPAGQDLVYVVLSDEEVGSAPEAEIAARRAAQTLAASGMTVSVRILGPRDPDFTTIVVQNGVGRFPAVLTVKKDGGIVLVSDVINEKNLLHAYRSVWGKTSSCEDAKSAVY